MKLISKILFTSLISMPLLAIAHDFTIGNNAKETLSFKINNQCVTNHEGFGTLYPNTSRVITKAAYEHDCANAPRICKIKVYTKNNCQGVHYTELGFIDNELLSWAGNPSSKAKVLADFSSSFLRFHNDVS